MRNTKKNRKRIWAGSGLLTITLAMAGMILFLIGYSESIHSTIVKREMEQVGETAHYITQTVISTFDQCVETLEIVEEIFQVDEGRTWNAYLEDLIRFRDRSGFTSVGILKLDGQGLDSEDSLNVPADKELYEVIRRDEVYISDILMDGSKESGQILIAVPLHRRGRVVGAVWGQYPIRAISEKMEEDKGAEQYFQIIDNEGRYISRSVNQHAFAKTLELWEELERYEFPNGETADSIRNKVENHESGQFYFVYEDQGRYVSYEPLGINNWYVFSVMVGDSLDGYVSEIRRHLGMLTICFSAFLIMIFAVIWRSDYKNRAAIEEKNRELSVKTSLLWMILGRTGDIPFEIRIGEKKMKLYRTYREEEAQNTEILEDFSADALLEKGWIRQEGYESYRKLYEAVLAGEQPEPLVLETNFDGKWGWKKLHLIREDKGTVIGFLEDYEEQKKKDRQLQETRIRTRVDQMTGLYNRTAFAEKVEDVLKQDAGGKNGMLSALFLLDLDYFKEVNDTLGHLMGDRVLCDAAQRIRAAVRKNDFAGRLGGDEFVLFIQDAAVLSDIHACARKLNSVLSEKYEKDGKTVWVSASIGIAVTEGETAFQELYERADAMLYEVKREGRNSYRIGYHGESFWQDAALPKD